MPDQQMISPFLNRSFIKLELKAADKDNSIQELSQPLIASGKVADGDMFISEIMERESKGSTGIGSGLAIPHCRTSCVNDILISIGRKHSGIEFDSIDGSKAQIFVLLAIPRDKMQTYIKIISKLTRVLNADGFRQKFLTAKTEDEILLLFKHTEESIQ